MRMSRNLLTHEKVAASHGEGMDVPRRRDARGPSSAAADESRDSEDTGKWANPARTMQCTYERRRAQSTGAPGRLLREAQVGYVGG